MLQAIVMLKKIQVDLYGLHGHSNNDGKQR